MTLKQLLAQSSALIHSGLTIELISAPGRGKSDVVRQITEVMSQPGDECGLAVKMLGTSSPIDLLGFMVPGKDEEGKLVSTFTRPDWQTTESGKPMHAYKRGVLFLDEFGQAEGDVKKAAADLLLNNRVGPHRMPPGWVVWAASNRMSDRSGVTKNFDFIINRRLEIHIQDDLTSLIEWMSQNNVTPTTMAFTQQNPQVVFTDGVPEKQGPWATPRSVVMADRLLKSMSPDGGQTLPTSPVAVELVAGLIGQGAAAQMMAFVRLKDDLPTTAEILKDPMNAKVPAKPDAQMLVSFSLAAIVDKGNAQPVIDYMGRLPKEFGVTFAKSACKREPMLVNTTAFTSWIAKNASLMAAVLS